MVAIEKLKHRIKEDYHYGIKRQQNRSKLIGKTFAGESQARNKYTFYASQARKDGLEQIAGIFEETANNEREHAKLWFKYLHNGAVGDTVTNLEDAAAASTMSGQKCTRNSPK